MVGNSAIGNVTINCTTRRFTIGGVVNGLVGAGLVLRNNGANDLSVGLNGAFTFGTALPSGAPYAVTVLTQPAAPSQICSVGNGSGSVGSANVSTVAVSCIYPNPNPRTLTSSVPSAYIGQSVRFDAAATDPNNLPLSYLWDFGDGAGASGSSVTHAYIELRHLTSSSSAFSTAPAAAPAASSPRVSCRPS